MPEVERILKCSAWTLLYAPFPWLSKQDEQLASSLCLLPVKWGQEQRLSLCLFPGAAVGGWSHLSAPDSIQQQVQDATSPGSTVAY